MSQARLGPESPLTSMIPANDTHWGENAQLIVNNPLRRARLITASFMKVLTLSNENPPESSSLLIHHNVEYTGSMLACLHVCPHYLINLPWRLLMTLSRPSQPAALRGTSNDPNGSLSIGVPLQQSTHLNAPTEPGCPQLSIGVRSVPVPATKKKINMRRVASWIEDDNEEDDEETPCKKRDVRTLNEKQAHWDVPETPVRTYDIHPETDFLYGSDVESIDLDDLPASPPPLRYKSSQCPQQLPCVDKIESKVNLESRSDSEDGDQITPSNSFFVSPQSSWMKRRPKRLNKLGHSISLPALHTRHSQSILISPTGSPIFEEEEPGNLVPVRKHKSHFPSIFFALWIYPIIKFFMTITRLSQSALQGLINLVDFLQRVIDSIQLYLEDLDATIDSISLALENLGRLVQREEQRLKNRSQIFQDKKA
ncbi:uncharacterized protein MELLADRAFT_112547 [Melampsora larici-populina 98AG31]|uniref:Uncharacterized protein n=1 Tax=Melampsora larici-populina (strain 98AG31 / pathotype 3-4-7) TaxID=747676 RepID=F4S6U5_MELLP|nr:uncharacterized protein MELLADRAFT_112547 [Melampsora larici-populina 98AG31]EGF99662.1 hypothetical protein MELLADRAFT_112547 [Melampsora larici-populina 98AG31]